MIAQCLGAILGAVCLGVFFTFDCGFGANALQPGVPVGSGFLAEVVLTCIFVLAILGVTSREGFSKVAGLVIGTRKIFFPLNLGLMVPMIWHLPVTGFVDELHPANTKADSAIIDAKKIFFILICF